MSDDLPGALAVALARKGDALAALDLAGIDRAAADEQTLLLAVAKLPDEDRRRIADLNAANRALAAQALDLANAFLRAPAAAQTYARSGNPSQPRFEPRFEAMG